MSLGQADLPNHPTVCLTRPLRDRGITAGELERSGKGAVADQTELAIFKNDLGALSAGEKGLARDVPLIGQCDGAHSPCTSGTDLNGVGVARSVARLQKGDITFVNFFFEIIG